MNQPFLSIGIPTWNRCAFLKNNLESLVMQIQMNHLEAVVEVLVSDNGSTDDTQSICEKMTSNYSFITYHRHPQNRGANANFQFVIEAAKGNYVWLLGDDDLLADVIKQVIEDLRQYKPDAIVGPAIYDNTKEKATHQSFEQIVVSNRKLLIQEDVIDLAGKMSGLMFNKASVLPYVSQAEKVIKETRTPWPHLAWLMLLLNDTSKKILVLPYGINQLVTENWHNLIFDGKTLVRILFVEYQALIKALKPYLDPDFYRELMATSVATRQANLLKCVLYGAYLNDYRDSLFYAGSSFYSITGFLNKLNYSLFLFLPLTFPVSVRKFAFGLIGKCWGKLNVTIDRLNAARKILDDQRAADRRPFDMSQL